MIERVPNGLLVVLSGPSGAGKGSICKLLTQDQGDISVSVSVTTRPPRQGEEEGVHYFFHSLEEFQAMLNRNEFLEHAKVHGNNYGTPRKAVEKELAAGRDVLLEIDVKGAMQVKENFPGCVMIFILPPDMAELERRIVGRASDSPETVEKRMKNAEGEIARWPDYDYVILNDKLPLAVQKTRAVIAAEKCRVDRNQGFYKQFCKEENTL